uniref:Uncharacterized protein n=1 Tax=uncultured bacterium contig00046 TaxID=1181532 RepID=A0A806JY91_9BACT|nr:hypothetical protein [uncultured bacterium contig00046]
MLKSLKVGVFTIIFCAIFASAQQAPAPEAPPPVPPSHPAPVAPAPQIQITDYETFLSSIETAILHKTALDKLKAEISDNKDHQPNWGGSLKKDADVETYKSRIDQFREKISAMKTRISHLDSLLAKVGFSASDLEEAQKSLQQKNNLYILRLERAVELMHDYIIQEQAKVLSTEKHKPQIGLGAYNAESQEYGIGISNNANAHVLFNYSGHFKIPEPKAKEMNHQTTDLTASIDYINFPFVIQGTSFFPAAKKAHIFYKDEEFPNVGSFNAFPSLEQHPGYAEWKLQADSLISGTLSPKNLDSLYAMNVAPAIVAPPPIVIAPPSVDTSSAIISIAPTPSEKIESGIPASSSSSEGSSKVLRNVLRWTSIGLSAACVGVGLMQNREVAKKNDEVNARYQEARGASSPEDYVARYNAYSTSKDDLKDAENIRNALYVGAGGFALVGILTFVF